MTFSRREATKPSLEQALRSWTSPFTGDHGRRKDLLQGGAIVDFSRGGRNIFPGGGQKIFPGGGQKIFPGSGQKIFPEGGQKIFPGGGQKIFPEVAKSGEIPFCQLQNQEKHFFSEKFIGNYQTLKSMGGLDTLPPFPTPMPVALCRGRKMPEKRCDCLFSTKVLASHWQSFKAASHRIRLRLTIRLMANGSLPTCSKNTITDNTGNPAYLKQF